MARRLSFRRSSVSLKGVFRMGGVTPKSVPMARKLTRPSTELRRSLGFVGLTTLLRRLLAAIG